MMIFPIFVIIVFGVFMLCILSPLMALDTLHDLKYKLPGEFAIRSRFRRWVSTFVHVQLVYDGGSFWYVEQKIPYVSSWDRIGSYLKSASEGEEKFWAHIDKISLYANGEDRHPTIYLWHGLRSA